ncbi:hypothetical protein LCGC14_2331990, partial [marine sediment metagenome]
PREAADLGVAAERVPEVLRRQREAEAVTARAAERLPERPSPILEEPPPPPEGFVLEKGKTLVDEFGDTVERGGRVVDSLGRSGKVRSVGALVQDLETGKAVFREDTLKVDFGKGPEPVPLTDVTVKRHGRPKALEGIGGVKAPDFGSPERLEFKERGFLRIFEGAEKLNPRERRLRDTIAQDIARDVPLDIIDSMKPPETQRVMSQIADIIENNPNILPKIPSILNRYGLSPRELAGFLRDAASKSGRTLGSFGFIGRRLRGMKEFQGPEVAAILEKFAEAEPAPWSWRWTMEKFSKVENIRLAAMISQPKTAVRNAMTQYANLGLHVVEDAIQGTFEATRGAPMDVAFARASADIGSFFRYLTPKGRKQVGDILDRVPLEAERLMTTPVLDVSMASKTARLLSTFSRTVEFMQRRMIFDGILRGELAAKGYNVKGAPIEWWSKIKPKDIAEAADAAVQGAVRLTFGEKLRVRAINTIYRDFPFMRLIQPFPRFFFGNAMKFIYNYSPAGFVRPSVWQAARKGNIKPLTRTLAGTAMLAWATSYRAQEDAPGRWNIVRLFGK